MSRRVTFTWLVLYFIAVSLPWIEGQFPRACATLDSLKSKECCPIPKGFSAPCGSDGNRGTCQELMIREWNFTYSHFKTFQLQDERHDWPNALYHKTCKCQSNFAGYDCSKCEFGYYGNNCTQKKTLTRKNFAKLSAEEKDRYMRYINMSKYFITDYVVTSTPYEEINRTVQAGGDPASLFHNITNYDLFVWMHYYAARDTIHPNNKTDSAIDFAHDGQGFPSWHRLYMLVWERTLQEIASDDNFSLPFWDWTTNKDECDPTICSQNLLGVTQQEDGVVKGKYFKDWYVICTAEQTNNLLTMCDPTIRQPGLERSTKKENENKAKTQGYTMTFPSKDEVNFALRFETFDQPPYSKESSCNFKNILEGYASTKTGYRLPNVHTLHNQVHIVVGGAMGDVPSASNDPIFPLHHSFVDRIYEKWLRKHNKDASVLSVSDAPIGHNKHDVIVPLFPLYTHQQMFKKSSEFGYEYEDVDENGKSSDDEDDVEPLVLGQCPVPCPEVSAVPSMQICLWLMVSSLAWELLLAD
ncbi:tyrosinase-like [Orbicella faveolata]|uniref:tyrosinase-like n=1 Tax=Orbicella faveolata TaxID=48498 RepID=UPI0009E25FCE|nr:tyrosinase-like [Orbicella faveolata]XP_020628305.1 tyrosinase-like [Orbicella faveolata]XP_020628308.1 tyrosinase-like [Orbicella faveolata]